MHMYAIAMVAHVWMQMHGQIKCAAEVDGAGPLHHPVPSGTCSRGGESHIFAGNVLARCPSPVPRYAKQAVRNRRVPVVGDPRCGYSYATPQSFINLEHADCWVSQFGRTATKKEE